MITGYRVMKLLLIPLKVRPAIISWLRLKMPKRWRLARCMPYPCRPAVPGVNGTLRPQYVYCKKLWKTDSGAYPLFTEKVSVFYRGTFITGEEFDGNFDGFGATDREIPLPLSDPLSENSPESKWPTAFNSPSEFVVSKVIAGWTWALQYMRVGERWMLYIPWQSGYGASGSSSGDIPGYTSLTFDVCLEGIAD